MTPGERLREIRALYDAVIDLPPAERAARLDAVEPLLRQTVERLLASPTGNEALESIGAKPPSVAGQQVGGYQLVRVVGVGGMATVFEGIRIADGTRVAIKIIRPGLVREITLRRFRQEQWILDSLAHPNIATLLDTGVTPDERPFLVMEYIAGDPLTDWCEAHELRLNTRVILFRQVCEAVEHSHQQGILHRDLKPDNILVTNGVVKLLDFGIAKLLQEEPALEAIKTSLGSRAFTPEYASPEQIEGLPLDVSTDVYSLGVVLFELVTGILPHEPRGETLLQYTQRVRDEPAPPLSSVHSREVGKDLDLIALRALAKDPKKRYPTVREFSEALTAFI